MNLICLETQRGGNPSVSSGRDTQSGLRGLKLTLRFIYWEHFRKSSNLFFPLHKHYLLIQLHITQIKLQLLAEV